MMVLKPWHTSRVWRKWWMLILEENQEKRHVSCNKIYEGLYGGGRICFSPCGPEGGNFRQDYSILRHLPFLRHPHLWVITPKYFCVPFLLHFPCQSPGSDSHLNLLGYLYFAACGLSLLYFHALACRRSYYVVPWLKSLGSLSAILNIKLNFLGWETGSLRI